MIKIENYISDEYVKEIITFGEHMVNSGYSLVGTDISDIYQSGYFPIKMELLDMFQYLVVLNI
jgi:hypothetical protein